MLSEAMLEVLATAPHYSYEGGPQMRARDAAVARVQDSLRTHIAQLAPAGAPVGLHVQGGGMMGKYSSVAWVRLYSPEHSPSAGEGHYLVYLFAADGSSVYLSLNQGTSERKSGTMRPIKGRPQLQAKATAARYLLKERTTSPRFSKATIDINLRGNPVQALSPYSISRIRNYEDVNVLAFRYDARALPADGDLFEDLAAMLPLLAYLYDHDGSAEHPSAEEPTRPETGMAAPRLSAGSQHPLVPAEPEGLLGRPASFWEGGTTDRQTLSTIRREQAYLRQHLLQQRAAAPCAICGEVLPARLLIAGHIKPRNKCTEKERTDFAATAMLVCALGCDVLFEWGYIVVGPSGRIRPGRPAETQELERAVDQLIGGICTAHNESTAANFQAHRALIERSP